MEGVKRVTIMISFVLLISALSVGFVFGYPTIDGSVSAGEWDDATNIYVASGMGTVKVIATTDYIYVLFNVSDSTDARLGQNLKGNDQIGFNINPTDGGSWGFPYDIIFQTGADPNAWGGISSGQTDGWETQWSIKVGGVTIQQPSLPSDLETKTIYSSGRRISEWKIPLVNITNEKPCDDLKVGGAIDVGDGNSYLYPVGLNWNDASTFIDISVKDVKEPDTNILGLAGTDWDLGEGYYSCDYWNSNYLVVIGESNDICSNIDEVQYKKDGASFDWAISSDGSFNSRGEIWHTPASTDESYYADGEHTVCSRATDASGNTEEINESDDCCVFCVDTQDPNAVTNLEADFEDCTGDNTYANTDCVKWTWDEAEDNGCAGIDYYIIKLFYSNGTYTGRYDTTTDTSYEFCNLEDGEDYYVKVWAVDKATNIGSYAQSDEVIIDLTDPEVNITGPDPDDWYDPSFIVTETDYDVNLDKCYYRIKNLKTDEYTLNWTETPCNENITIDPTIYCPNDGPYCKVYKKAVDKACNDKWTSKIFNIDTHNPIINKTVGEPKVEPWGNWIEILTNGWFITDETEIILSCDDGEGSGVQAIYYRIDGGNWTRIDEENLSCDNSFTFNLEEDGIHTIEYYCIDKVNKTSEIKNETDKVDIEAPIVTKTCGLPSLLGYRIIQGINMLIHYITSQTTITLNATDEEVGVNETWWTLFAPSSEGGMSEWYGQETNKIYESEEDCYNDGNEICNVTYWYPKYDYMLQYCPEENRRIMLPWEVYWCLYEGPITINQSCDHKICYLSIDKLGNYNWPPKCQVFSVDNMPPEIIIHNPTDNETKGIGRCDQSIVVEVWDNKVGVNESSIYAELYYENGSLARGPIYLHKAVYPGDNGSIYEGLMDKQLPAGNYTLKIHATDKLGNEAIKEKNETLSEGIFVEYLDPASCVVDMEEGGNCTFGFHVCVRGANAIKMCMDKLGENPGLITPDMLNARISKGNSSSYVGLSGITENCNGELLILSEEKINGKAVFNLNLEFTSNITSLIGAGNYDLEYEIEAYDP